MQTLNKHKALVLFSGGQDSSIALAYALNKFDIVETVGFDYGQRHAVELGARSAVRREFAKLNTVWSKKLGPDALIDLSGLGRISDTAMTRESEIYIGENGLPTTFVPGRNLMFLTMAGALAYRRDAGVLVAGMCETDFSGYPDCREEALTAQINAMRLGMDADIELDTPLMNIDKAESWRVAEKIGEKVLVDSINEFSHTCYRGIRSERHEWGYGCGDCPACELRKSGWEKYAESKGAA